MFAACYFVCAQFQGAAVFTFGNPQHNLGQAAQAFNFTSSGGNPSQNGYSVSAVGQERLIQAQQQPPRRPRPYPQIAQQTSSAPVQQVIGNKRKALELESSDAGAVVQNSRPVQYQQANPSTGNAWAHIPCDTNTQDAYFPNAGRAPRKYLWGTSRLRRGARDVQNFVNRPFTIASMVPSFGSCGQPSGTPSISVSFDDEDTTEFVGNPAKKPRTSYN